MSARRLVHVLLLGSALIVSCDSSDQGEDSRSLPRPSQVSRTAFQDRLYDYLSTRRYRELGFRRDKRIRDTGPYRNGVYFGTHPAVRVYYSDEVIRWLENGREGAIPDGAVIVKEMFPPPAARYEGHSEDALPVPKEWTVMVRDAAGAADGWYWSYFSTDAVAGANPPVPIEPDDDDFPFLYPNSDFGLYCVRCHASAERQLTFSTLDNVEGYPGEPIAYDVDDSWREAALELEDPHPSENDETAPLAPSAPQTTFTNETWLALYDQFSDVTRSQVAHLPPETTDHIPADGHRGFATSDQCMSCHAGDTSAFGPNLVVPRTADAGDRDLSPWGEWRWSMMGLAGRDPIFYAQLETETTLLDRPGTELTPAEIEHTCLRCHGVMGHRQFVEDHPDQLYSVEKALAHEEGDPDRVYGGLSRDGISCMVCHRIEDESARPLQETDTGRFGVKPPDANGVIDLYGPFADPPPHAMLQAMKVRPVESTHITSSRLCGNCHSILLPVTDVNGKVLGQKYEQVTFQEWLNSDFRDGGSAEQSCQDCHMPESFEAGTKIANIQDADFPETAFTAPEPEITVPLRIGYRRHALTGINVFGLQFFDTYPDILGVRLQSFMTGFDTGLQQMRANMVEQARGQSAELQVLDLSRSGDKVTTRLKVINKVGHRLPSGVGFRRVVLELLVLTSNGGVIWSSGRMNDLGVIVDENGSPLPSEFHEGPAGAQAFQPHHELITSPSQAQIYSELLKDSEGIFTTSFLQRVEDVKDNRLLPLGWTPAGPPGFDPEFAETTMPVGEAASDPNFVDGTGSDTITYEATLPAGTAGPLSVRATLYYQAIPPSYLMDRFRQANGPATRRLHYLGAHLDTSSTPFPGWRLPMTSVERGVPSS